MFTASHNPAQYNGIKLCRAYAAPVGTDTGLAEIKDLVATATFRTADQPGEVATQDVLADYADHLRRLVPVTGRPLKVVVDAGNGMAGHTAPAVLGSLGIDLDVVELYYELDGTFPNHEANPIEPENLRDLQAAVLGEGADLGLAFDGDADRCFVVDETGTTVSPSVLTALIAVRELAKEPGATIIHNLITSRAVPQIVSEHGGRPVRTRVGHSYIKGTMAETEAIFGGEHSGHFYFRDFWRADSGMLAALHTLAALAEQDRPLSVLLQDYARFVSSGEINSTVEDQEAVLEQVEAAFADEPGATVDNLDGLTETTDDWWFNIRASNTEPLLRLNAEGSDEDTMVGVRDRVLAMVRGEA
jgi:phosphomannomutase